MNIEDTIPKEAREHLEKGNIITVIAKPLDKNFQPISFGFDLHSIYEVKILPEGIHLNKEAVAQIPEGATIDHIFQSILGTIVKMSTAAGVGAVMLEFGISKENKVKSN